jgi:hypothetical protein
MSAERRIIITAGDVVKEAVLHNTSTADAIWQALPIEARVNTWGDEIYFSIPVNLAGENSQDVVGVGDLAYWPPGSAFCIFWGPTPASIGDEIRPASPVNVFGKVNEGATEFRRVPAGTVIRIERAP